MTREGNDAACPVCGNVPHAADRRVLVSGRVRLSYCSQSCLRIGVRATRIAQRKARLRRFAILLAVALAVGGVGYVRHLVRLARTRHVAASAPPPVAHKAPPEPASFGPHWPPTDDEWQEQFARAAWVNPLPGPSRRRPVACPQRLGADAAAAVRARCRSAGHCGVDLGGELWGEHVYAALDGVIERVQRKEDAPGGLSVRIAHWGGAVFTQYFHLAAIPSRLFVGTHVRAGDVIGLVGDTGVADARAHLHFALSVRPSRELPEVYWDPAPLMEKWPLQTPVRGSVAGLVSLAGPAEHVAGTPGVRVPSRPRIAKRPRARHRTTTAD